jgi:hypothetical protein
MKRTNIAWLAAGAMGVGLGCATLIGLDPADPPPACTDQADQSALGRNQATFVADMVACAVQSMGSLSASSACIQSRDKLSKACADCSAANGACALAHCAQECGDGTGSTPCQQCVAQYCNADLLACAGTPLYACVDGPDMAALAGHMSSLETDVKNCGSAHSIDLSATAACVASLDGLTLPCAICYVQAGECAVTNCTECVQNPDSGACATCVTTSCDLAFALCTGIPPDDGGPG